MKFGFFIIPFMAASVWGMPWSLMGYGLIYILYLRNEGKYLIKEIVFHKDIVILKPVFGKQIESSYQKNRFEVHVYKGAKFFESKVILYNDRYKINDSYWNKETFKMILDELETRL